MKKIDTWLFIVMFVIVYAVFFWLATFILLPLLASVFLMNTTSAIYIVTFIISSLACFLAAFGLRSYYFLPTSLIKVVTGIVIVQFLLNALSAFVEKPTLSSVGIWLSTALVTWLILYASFWVSERYFGKR